MTENKTYEEITPEERDARNREAFTWEDGDVVITSTGTGWGRHRGRTGRLDGRVSQGIRSSTLSGSPSPMKQRTTPTFSVVRFR
jgi:hypothetical protein